METMVVSEIEQATQKIVDKMFSEVEKKYGTGNGDGEHPLKYHNLEHSRDVYNDSLAIAALAVEQGKINTSKIDALKRASSAHDCEQMLGSGLNERESCAIVAQKMKECKMFSDEEINETDDIIMATEIQINNGVLHQSAKADNYLGQILADADLANLGQEHEVFWRKYMNFVEEASRGEPSRELLITLYRNEINLLKNHRYYTPEAETLFPHQRENLELVQNKFTELMR